MGELKKQLIRRALEKHKKILPCMRRKNFNACFTEEEDNLLFWYNTPDRSTHVVSAKMLGSKCHHRRRAATAAG